MVKRKHPESKQVKLIDCMECECADCGVVWKSMMESLPRQCPACHSTRWHIPKADRRRPGRPKKEGK